MVENLPAMQETQVQSLEWEDPLEKEMATHSRVLAWRIPWTEEPGGLQSMGSQKSQTWLSNYQRPTTRQVFEHAFDLEAFFPSLQRKNRAQKTQSYLALLFFNLVNIYQHRAISAGHNLTKILTKILPSFREKPNFPG